MFLGKTVRSSKSAVGVLLSPPPHSPHSLGASSGWTRETAYSKTPAHSFSFWNMWEAQGKQNELGTEDMMGTMRLMILTNSGPAEALTKESEYKLWMSPTCSVTA